jgi:hypothetical protein
VVESHCKSLAPRPDGPTLLTHVQESGTRTLASILQAFLRTNPGIAPGACGRRCLAGNHLRTWCPPNKPARLGSGSGESWFDPRRGNLKGRSAHAGGPFGSPSLRFGGRSQEGQLEARCAHDACRALFSPDPVQQFCSRFSRAAFLSDLACCHVGAPRLETSAGRASCGKQDHEPLWLEDPGEVRPP